MPYVGARERSHEMKMPARILGYPERDLPYFLRPFMVIRGAIRERDAAAE